MPNEDVIKYVDKNITFWCNGCESLHSVAGEYIIVKGEYTEPSIRLIGDKPFAMSVQGGKHKCIFKIEEGKILYSKHSGHYLAGCNVHMNPIGDHL